MITEPQRESILSEQQLHALLMGIGRGMDGFTMDDVQAVSEWAAGHMVAYTLLQLVFQGRADITGVDVTGDPIFTVANGS